MEDGTPKIVDTGHWYVVACPNVSNYSHYFRYRDDAEDFVTNPKDYRCNHVGITNGTERSTRS